jgi:glycosyltransferase involved in cell wall biosynthesis
MKVALVHELLTMKGGAEQVLRIFAEMFPEAPIYTLLYDEKKLGDWFPKERVRTSSIQKYAISKNHHLYLPFFPKAVESWNSDEFDLIISSSSAFAHGLKTHGKTKHLSYIHSPARYLWDRTHDVQKRAELSRFYLSPLFQRLRVWDAEVASRPDSLIAASKEVQRRIELYWNRESDVVYPPINDEYFTAPGTRSLKLEARSYFLIVSTLAPYKRIDLAIEACNRLRLPLLIAGDGPDRRRLEGMAGPTVQFLGYQTTEQLKDLYSSAIATIFPGHEDFGLVPVESMACGTPVIAYKGGGALETVIEGETGAFFDEMTADSLISTLQNFDQKMYSNVKCTTTALKFGKSNFVQQIYSQIARLGIVNNRG